MRLHQEGKGRTHLRLVTPAEDDSPAPIDVSAALDGLEATLRWATSADERRGALSLLRSWEWNEQIADSCQQRARALLHAFVGRH